jgi:hypothetical protein
VQIAQWAVQMAQALSAAAKVKRAIAVAKKMRRWIFSEFAFLQICT